MNLVYLCKYTCQFSVADELSIPFHTQNGNQVMFCVMHEIQD